MKKIFTLLSLLVLTLTAMATTFTGHRIVTVGYLDPLRWTTPPSP